MLPLGVELRDKSGKPLVLSSGSNLPFLWSSFHWGSVYFSGGICPNCLQLLASFAAGSPFLTLCLYPKKIFFLEQFSRFFLKTEFVSVTCCCAIWTPGNVQSSCVSKSLKVFWLMLVNHLLVVSRICLGKMVCTVPKMKLMHHLFLCYWCWSTI